MLEQSLRAVKSANPLKVKLPRWRSSGVTLTDGDDSIAPRRGPRISRKTAPVMSKIFETEVAGAQTIRFKLEFSGQHTLSWDTAITMPPIEGGETEVIEPGACNLYTYPKVQFHRLWATNGGRGDTAEPPRLLAGPLISCFSRAVQAVMLDDNDLLEKTDAAGAHPIHALLLANSPPAMQLAMSILQARPRVMLQAHEGEPFEGENTLHVMIVNRREQAHSRSSPLAPPNATARVLSIAAAPVTAPSVAAPRLLAATAAALGHRQW